jgi:CBS domain-containing protein
MAFLDQKAEPLMQSVNKFARCTTEDTIGSVIDKIRSSHDAIIVYREDNPDQFAGLLVNQTPTGKTPHPHSAKVGNFIVVPPQLSRDSTLLEVLEAMVEFRLDIMPLRGEDDKVEGAVEAASILKSLGSNDDNLRVVAAAIKPNKAITAQISATVEVVANLMSKNKISRIVLTSDSGVVVGIVSRRDLLDAYTRPNDRLRFAKGGDAPASRSFDTEKVPTGSGPIAAYAKAKVEMSLDTSPLIQSVRRIADGQSSSIVLVNAVNQPTGFISRRDILEALVGLRSESRQPVIFKHTDMQISQSDQQQLERLAQIWATKLAVQFPISQIVVSYEITAKSSEGKVNEIETTLIVDPAAGPSSDSIIAKVKSRSWLEGLREAMGNIDKQLRRRA